MTWTIEEIEKDWQTGHRIAVSRENMREAFERCERVLGRDWIDARRASEAGIGPTLAVVRMGSDWRAWRMSQIPAS